MKSVTSGVEDSGEFKLDGKDYVFGTCDSAYFDSTMIYALTPGDFIGGSSGMFRTIVICGIILLLLTVFSSMFFSRRLSKPIVSATARIRELAQGNLSAPVDVWYSKDELGVLTSSL
jgi:methyl-accepting chemotaxis protein